MQRVEACDILELPKETLDNRDPSRLGYHIA